MPLTNEQLKERTSILKEIEEIEKRLEVRNAAIATADAEQIKILRQKNKEDREALAIGKELLETSDEILANDKIAEANRKKAQADEKKAQADQKLKLKYQKQYLETFHKIDKDTKDLLTSQGQENSILLASATKLGEMKAAEVGLEGEALIKAQQKRYYLQSQQDSLIQQAKEYISAKNSLDGQLTLKQRQAEFEENTKDLSGEDLQIQKDIFNQKENLLKQTEILKQKQEGLNSAMGAVPGSLGKAIPVIKNMITGIRAFGLEAAIATAGITLIIGAIVAGLEAFTALESAGEDFRKETGITNSEMSGIQSKVQDISVNYAQFGVEAKDVYDTVAALKSEFADFADYSTAAVSALTVMKTNFGVSAETAAKVQGVMENIGGLSEDTAASVQLQVANMSKLAGVAPKKVMEDIAKSAEHASTIFKGDINLIAKQAVEARRLGANLESVSKTAEKLLDFEGGIEDELKAATFVGGQFNLSTARGLAMQGKAVEANQEILNQIQQSGDFRKKDYFTQQALAKAAGKSVEEINKELNVRDKLGRLSEEDRKRAEKAIEAGLDISKINDDQLEQKVKEAAAQQEMASSVTKMENEFKGIIASVGGALLPIFKILTPIITALVWPFKIIAQAIQFIIDGITWLLKKIPGVSKFMDVAGGFFDKVNQGIPSVSSLTGGEGSTTAESGQTTEVLKAQDLLVPESGAPMVMAKGKVYQGALGDEVAMSPGIASNGAATQNNTVGNIGNAFNGAANSIVSEIKALRADLAAGKIGISMDGTKVTKGISNAIDKSTRNNYSLS